MNSFPNRDRLSRSKRSAHMAKIRSAGNQSTEMAVESVFRKNSITGWQKQPKEIVGRPDFFFPKKKLAVFIHGCFWHGCQKCQRNTPQRRREFWVEKIQKNRRRDARVLRRLQRLGYRTITVWEHSLLTEAWLYRVRRVIE